MQRLTWCGMLVGTVVVLAAQGIDPKEVRVSAVPYFPKPEYAVKMDSRLVEVGVVVRDSRGHPVSGLGKSDFQVWDNGKRREVSAFSVQSFTPAATAPAAPSAGASPRPAKPRFVGMVFDDISMPPGDLYHAKAAARNFLKAGLAANDRVAVLTISSGLVLPFSADKTALLAAIDKVVLRERKIDSTGCPLLRPYDAYLIANHQDSTALEVKAEELMACSPGICGGGRPRGGGATTACLRAMTEVQEMAKALWEQVRMQSLNTIETLRNVVDFMARMDGTRVVLLASSGFLSGTLEYEQDEIVDRALRANVVINSLDAKGLYTEDPPEIGQSASVRSGIYAQATGTRSKDSGNDALGNLADSTGGLFFHNRNDLDLGFRELGMQPETSYLLGYVPDPPDSRYHRLKVSLAAKSHDNVQARKGYMAVAPPEEKPAPQRPIDRELLSGNQSNGAPVTVTAHVEKLEDGTPVAHVSIQWDVNKVPFRLKDGARLQNLRVVAALLDERGNFVTGKEGLAELELSESSYGRLARSGLKLGINLEAAPGVYQLRTVAGDDGEENLSASTQPVELK